METKNEILMLNSLLECEQFKNTDYELPIALGKTVGGDVFMLDLSKIPHLLIAGGSGQGKTVSINAITKSLQHKREESELKFELIYTKQTELDAVVQTLQSLCNEMEDRFQLLRKAKARNIKDYNNKFALGKLKTEEGYRNLPYIVVVIDEFADIILSAGREFETPIVKLAQMSRAVGIHLIIATQHISNKVLTGVILANFSARLVFKVQEKEESSYLLGFSEATLLKRPGDAFYSCGNEITHLQCAFISD